MHHLELLREKNRIFLVAKAKVVSIQLIFLLLFRFKCSEGLVVYIDRRGGRQSLGLQVSNFSIVVYFYMNFGLGFYFSLLFDLLIQ